ncbi:M1 family aminopeptidase [Pleionea sp. CnH1-48]|uniref:M1 family aminopeptidase n=1 Tax=Pleionea sp. CnH1-48 TaxID=2954494 RepID=UPI0020979878|nr:M1 family aminopeptidase [Pleionea sp. CnH1-48]MCO7224401.1 hypothetical protein [Pleionea sp. CnH1-48]
MCSSTALANIDYIKPFDVDFVHYHAKLEPDFKDQSVAGIVQIDFMPIAKNVRTLTFSAEYKSIKSINLNGKPAQFSLHDKQLIIDTSKSLSAEKLNTLAIEYQAKPRRGMRFHEDHLYTVYHTKNWLVAHNNINDKASFELELIHDKKLISQGNGLMLSQKKLGEHQVISHWHQPNAMPIYTFGFALGEFESFTQKVNETTFSFLYTKGSELSKKSIQNAFSDVPDMLQFFEQKSGFPLPQGTYAYVIVEGRIAQESAGFSLVGERFVHTVLKNKSENWFIAHELAHEWWGNSVTCANFSHFWLNEGLVQFLVAAYKQHLFGEQAYKDEINVAIRRVKRAVKENRVAPVAFYNEINEQEINRTMAYSKGALVFYMLREKLGDKLFWQALKQYTMTYKDKSVTTQDLKSSFEKTTSKDLSDFFNRWVYGHEIPTLQL